MEGKVISVSKSPVHNIGKDQVDKIELIANFGVKGDAHAGKTVKHRYLVKKNPSSPNLRQVHLIPNELLTNLKKIGYDISPGQIGENICTQGLDLINLPYNTILCIGDAEIEIKGLRNPCKLLNKVQEGLMKQLIQKDKDGSILRLAGIMGVVKKGGIISKGMKVQVVIPHEHIPLDVV